jgi:hypothetical protein
MLTWASALEPKEENNGLKRKIPAQDMNRLIEKSQSQEEIKD